MDTKTEKLELIEWLVGLEDEALLENIKSLKESTEGAPVSWNDLSETEKAGIRRGLEDVKAGRVRPHEEVRKTYEKWL